jgi:hypothetical protein
LIVTKKLNLKGKVIMLFLLSFSTLLYSKTSISNSLINKISISHKWKAILHIRDNKPKINNDTFLLSYNNFSLKNELLKTIKSFEEGRNICKFPARYYLLNSLIKKNNFKKQNCIDFDNYILKTNTKNLDLVFAAENISSPSSMMGHVFFKLNSKKENNVIKKNSVSFFTLIDTFNLPLLITKSTITGMKGFFILNPYEEQVSKYLLEENRSIWEYKLELSDNDKRLILYHFWELKDINITYFFTGFNCATMIDDILSITKEDYQESSLWVTPKDVIKNAKKNKIIDSVKMIPSLEWELNMLSENISKIKIDNIIKIFNEHEFEKFNSFNFSKNRKDKKLEKYFISTYSNYLYLNKNTLNSEELIKIKKIVNTANNIIDIKDYKNPINTFNDSQTTFSFSKEGNKEFIGLNFLAASNTLYDDNREYFSENSLKIGEVNLKVDSKKIHLNSIDLYNMKLLIPWNNITRTFSKEFKVGYERHRKKNLDRLNVINILGGLGITNKIHDDIFFFNVAKIGLGLNFEKTYPYSIFETGFIIYELFNMKTVLSHEFVYNQNNSDNTYNNFSLNQSIFFNSKDYKLDLYYNKKLNDSFSYNTLTFGLTYFF